MARKPVKVITDLQVKKRIKKVDNNDNVLFDVSGTLSNGHVSSSLPLTASSIYTPGNLIVEGTLSAKQLSITEVTTSVVYENAISASINALYDVSASNATAGQVLQWNGTSWVAADVAGGGGGGDITAVIAGTNLSGGGTTGSVTLNVANSINLTVVTASYFSGTFIGNGAQLNNLPLSNYATLSGVSASFATPAEITSSLINYATNAGVTGAISNLASKSDVTGALNNYATLTGVSSSFTTAAQITGALAIYATKTDVTGVLSGYATSANVSASFVTPAQLTGSLNSYLTISNASSSFAELSDLTASNISNFTSDVRSQFSAGTDIDISSGVISYTGTGGGGGLTSVETSGSITGSGIVANPITLKDPLLIGVVTASLGFSGNLIGTASYSTYAATASYVQNAESASYVLNSVSSSFSTNSLTASTSYIGAAEDGDYTDGLFTDITTTTPVGTVVDRFNEILKALAPPPAPNLSNVERTAGTVGTSRYLAFGTGINDISGYTAVTASLTGLPNIAFANNFTSSLGPSGTGTGYIRLGVYAAPVVITMSLNNATTANSSSYTNYPAKAYNVSADGIGTYKLEVNGTDLTPTGSTTTTASANTATFVLTTANTGTFITSGQGLDLFRHRTGTVGIPTSSWRNGHNYARVTHVSSLGTHTTNHIDWVYDPTGSSGVEAYTFTTPTSASFSATGQKSLSGVKYYTSITYNFSSSIDNYYKNTYSTSGLTIGSVTTGLTTAAITIPTPTLNTSNIQFSNLHTFNQGYRILNGTLTSTLTAANGLGKTGSTVLTTNTILYDNINSPANTTVIEYFLSENYRGSSGSYDTQTSASNAIGSFSSGSSLASGELAVYNGAVRYPTQLLNSGNISGSGITHMISGQPNYSGVTDNRGYFRVFQNGSSAIASFTLAFTGSSGITIVPYNTALGTNSARVWIKVPGKTGWRDISTSAPGSTSGIALNDNVGALQGSITTTSTTSQHTVNLLTEALAPSEYFLLKIEASSAFTNNISRITITGL